MQKIWTINNKEEKKLLKKKLRPFDFNQYSPKEINKLIREMDESMQKANGIGLSANQIGLDMRVFVARWDGKFYAIFNPKIEKKGGDKEIIEEGCLSMPGKYGEVSRSGKITISGFNKQGKKIRIDAWGMLAIIFQHEIDHLNGKLFMDRMKRGVKLRDAQ